MECFTVILINLIFLSLFKNCIFFQRKYSSFLNDVTIVKFPFLRVLTKSVVTFLLILFYFFLAAPVCCRFCCCHFLNYFILIFVLFIYCFVFFVVGRAATVEIQKFNEGTFVAFVGSVLFIYMYFFCNLSTRMLRECY